MSSDAQIARQWAEYITSVRELHGDYAPQARAAARFILATTRSLTMAEVEWDNYVHAGLCAEHPVYGVVRMLGVDYAGDIHFLHVGEEQLRSRWTYPAKLTPIPGTKIDLTPRREPEPEPESTPEPEDVKPDPQPGEAWLIEYEGKRYEAIYWHSPIYAHWAFVENREGLKTVESPEAVPVSRLVREAAPSHPEFLTTEADYENAPEGTVVADSEETPWTKWDDSLWKHVMYQDRDNYAMANSTRRVLRWGWKG